MQPELVDVCPDNTALGTCYLCNTDCGGPYLRTFRVIDWEGELVIGDGCLSNIVDQAGFLSKRARAGFLTQLKNLKDRVEYLKPRADAYELVRDRISELATTEDGLVEEESVAV